MSEMIQDLSIEEIEAVHGGAAAPARKVTPAPAVKKAAPVLPRLPVNSYTNLFARSHP